MYCVSGVRSSCPAGTYGASPGLISAACDGLCAEGYVCPAGSRSGSALQCPTGYYCHGGVVDPCPSGTYNARTGMSRAANCTLCPPNTFGAGLAATSDAACTACARYENSTAGALACWPGLIAAVAANPPPVIPSLTARDTLTLSFSKPTNKPAVDSDADVHALLVFSSSIGASLTGSWNALGTLLTVTVGATNAADGGSLVNLADTRVGVLTVALNASAALRDAALRSPPASYAPALVSGDWGVATIPEFLDATSAFAPSFARNTGGQAGLGVGDTLVLRFDNPCKQVAVSHKVDLDRLLVFSAPLGANYTGAWETSGLFARSAITITVTAPPANASGTAVGVLRVTVLASAGLTSLDESTPASNATTVVALGTWGDAPTAVVEARSWRSLRVTMAPPASRVAWTVGSYRVQWSPRANFSAGPGDVVRDAPVAPGGGEDAVYTVTGASVGVPLFVRVAALVFIRFKDEVIVPASVGPFFVVPYAVTPALPVLSSVRIMGGSGTAMATTGLQTALLLGSNLGLAETPTVINATYTNGAFTLVASDCRVTVRNAEARCETVPGVGAGYVWTVIVDGGAGSPGGGGAGAVTLSFDAPVVSSFSGPGAVSAATAGGDVVVLHGSNFGPLGAAFVTSVLFYTSDVPDVRYPAVGCAVTDAHVAITCTIPFGAGARVSWVVAIAGLSSSSPSTSFAAPRVSAVARPGNASLLGFATLGGEPVVITGSNFGPSWALDAWQLGAALVRGTEAPVPLIGCNVTAEFGQLTCRMPPGRGAGFALVASVMKQVSTPAPAAIGYAPPALALVGDGAGGAALLHPEGGAPLSLAGAGFGTGSVSVFWCGSAAAAAAPLPLLTSTGACVERLPPPYSARDGDALQSLSPPLVGPLAGVSRVWLLVAVAGQASIAAVVPVAAPTIAVVTAQEYTTLAAARAGGGGGGEMDARTIACVDAMAALPFPAAWWLLVVSGTDLAAGAAASSVNVTVAPVGGDAGDGIGCAVCAAGASQLLCIARTSTAATRNGLLTLSQGERAASFQMHLDVSPAPRLLSLAGGDGLAGAIAVGTSGGPGPQAGDVLRLRFASPVAPVLVNSTAALDALLEFSGRIGSEYTGGCCSRLIAHVCACWCRPPPTAPAPPRPGFVTNVWCPCDCDGVRCSALQPRC